MKFNLLDITIALVIIYCFIRGLIRGFLKELVSFLCVILSIILTNRYHPLINNNFLIILPKGRYIPLLSFLFFFISSYIILSILAWLIESLILKGGAANALSRIFGATLGTIKALVVVYLFTILLGFSVPPKSPIIAKSRFAPIIIHTYKTVIVPIFPSYFKKFKKSFLSEIKKVEEKIEKIHPGK